MINFNLFKSKPADFKNLKKLANEQGCVLKEFCSKDGHKVYSYKKQDGSVVSHGFDAKNNPISNVLTSIKKEPSGDMFVTINKYIPQNNERIDLKLAKKAGEVTIETKKLVETEKGIESSKSKSFTYKA